MIQTLSIPRSGHHFLIDLLTEHIPELTYCEFYHCCESVPCLHSKIIQKNHDFDLSLPISKFKTIVQYRQFVPAAVSDFLLRVNDKANLNDLYKRYHAYDGHVATRSDFINFLDWFKNYYAHFIVKWVIQNNSNTIKIHYDDLNTNTVNVVNNITNSLFKTEYTYSDYERFKNGRQVHVYNSLKDFVYYDLDLLKDFENQVLKIINSVNSGSHVNNTVMKSLIFIPGHNL